MQVVSLHPIEPEVVTAYIAALRGEPVPAAWSTWFREGLRDDLRAARANDERAATRLTYGLAQALSDASPSYYGVVSGLTFWEARVDRSIGMLMRPPSRLFQDAGLDADSARAMPIRVDLHLGMMGGAYIPARLMDQAAQLFDEHLERSARRLVEGENEPYAALALMYEAVAYARDRGLGLYEAQDVLGPSGETSAQRTVVAADRKRLPKALADRVEIALTPPKKPGLFQRLMGRGSDHASNGHGPLPDQDQE